MKMTSNLCCELFVYYVCPDVLDEIKQKIYLFYFRNIRYERRGETINILTGKIESFASVRRVCARVRFFVPGTRNGSRQQVVIRPRSAYRHERIGSPGPRIGSPTSNDGFLWLKIDGRDTCIKIRFRKNALKL